MKLGQSLRKFQSLAARKFTRRMLLAAVLGTCGCARPFEVGDLHPDSHGGESSGAERHGEHPPMQSAGEPNATTTADAPPQRDAPPEAESRTPSKNSPPPVNKADWVSLFNGKDLTGWKITEFGGEGDVDVKDGQLLLDFGNDLTGVTYTGKLPKTDYEVALEAMRVDGSDFFCGLTFPVNDDHCSLILGGWGGGVCGLSSIDGMDASENETTTYEPFENGRWYKVRLRVTEPKIEAWLDDKQIIDQDIQGRQISIRFEVDPSRPLGIATWQTSAALRNLRLRHLPAPISEPPPAK